MTICRAVRGDTALGTLAEAAGPVAAHVLSCDPSLRSTQLQQRLVQKPHVAHVGKEANNLEEVEAGLKHDWDEVQLVVHKGHVDHQQ